ncbi:MAG: arylesterase [Mesorhizobium sp.]|nr:arylesterase [Mesorhizobium sp.]MCO5161539.1 arylesterase [Mesorhizobium sp.]
MAFKQVKHAIFTALICVVALTGQAAADTFRIVGFGDSLMAGYNLGPNEGFPQKLEAALKARGHDVSVANAGVSGDTTSGGLSRLDWSVPDGTDLVILELGANDMLRGVAPEITEQNLDAMMASLRKRGIGVVLAGMLAAPNLGPDYATAFNGIYPKLAEKYDAPLIPFFLDGVAANPSLQLEDGLHPSAAGVDRMVEGALPVIEPLVR